MDRPTVSALDKKHLTKDYYPSCLVKYFVSILLLSHHPVLSHFLTRPSPLTLLKGNSEIRLLQLYRETPPNIVYYQYYNQ